MGQPAGLASGILPLPLPHDGGLRAGQHLPGYPYHHDCGADCPEAASAGAVSICRCVIKCMLENQSFYIATTSPILEFRDDFTLIMIFLSNSVNLPRFSRHMGLRVYKVDNLIGLTPPPAGSSVFEMEGQVMKG